MSEPNRPADSSLPSLPFGTHPTRPGPDSRRDRAGGRGGDGRGEQGRASTRFPTRAARLRPAPGALPVRCPPSPRAPGEPRASGLCPPGGNPKLTDYFKKKKERIKLFIPLFFLQWLQDL